jgi:hypothetical protein
MASKSSRWGALLLLCSVVSGPVAMAEPEYLLTEAGQRTHRRITDRWRCLRLGRLVADVKSERLATKNLPSSIRQLAA